jgi:hypothetical protein
MTRNPVPLTAQSGDDLDRALRAFFQAQMPNPWPKAPSPAISLRPFRARRSRLALFRSRAALAASVALLIFGSWWLAGHSEPLASETAPIVHGGSADASDRVRGHHGNTPHSVRPHQAVPEHERDPMKLLDPRDLPPMK